MRVTMDTGNNSHKSYVDSQTRQLRLQSRARTLPLCFNVVAFIGVLPPTTVTWWNNVKALERIVLCVVHVYSFLTTMELNGEREKHDMRLRLHRKYLLQGKYIVDKNKYKVLPTLFKCNKDDMSEMDMQSSVLKLRQT